MGPWGIKQEKDLVASFPKAPGQLCLLLVLLPPAWCLLATVPHSSLSPPSPVPHDKGIASGWFSSVETVDGAVVHGLKRRALSC